MTKKLFTQKIRDPRYYGNNETTNQWIDFVDCFIEESNDESNPPSPYFVLHGSSNSGSGSASIEQISSTENIPVINGDTNHNYFNLFF